MSRAMDRSTTTSDARPHYHASRKPLVLHISADYPDPYRSPTTTAIERLVTGSPDVDHVVVSLNRTSRPDRTHFRDCGMVHGARLFAFRYFGLPFGLGLAPSMRAVARRIAGMLEAEGFQPDVVHAHKFAFEGIAGLWLVECLGKDTRLFVSVRGESEANVLRYKPTYIPLFQRIADRATRIYYVSAWFKPILNARLTIEPGREALLPNIVGNTRASIPVVDPEPRFVCVLNFDIRRRKGLRHLLEAFRNFRDEHPHTGLDLIGWGGAESVAAVKADIARLELEESVRLLGKMENTAVTAALPKYLGLALPSFNETFGMVYLEALFAGIPILYGRGTGIDGYLDGLDVGVAATPGSVPEITSGLRALYTRNDALRTNIRESARVLHKRFDPRDVLGRYRHDLASCMVRPEDEGR